MEAEVAEAKARRLKEGLLKDEANDRRVTMIAKRKYFMSVICVWHVRC
jgi:hypothetical protein